MTKFNGTAHLSIIDDPAEIKAVGSFAGKPFIRATFESGEVVNMSLNLAGMIGGVGDGANQRFGFTPSPDMGKKH